MAYRWILSNFLNFEEFEMSVYSETSELLGFSTLIITGKKIHIDILLLCLKSVYRNESGVLILWIKIVKQSNVI